MYDRIVKYATSTPWALEPSKLAIIADLLRFRASGGRLSAEEIQARVGDAGEKPQPKQDGNVAVIPVFGVISHRMNSFDAMSGGTSTELLGKYIQRAVADDSVKAILLDISSPGGTVSGVPELAAQIAAAAKVKHVVASANALAASAAYWLGSQASEFVVTPSGNVGSIGVYLLTEDWSAYLEKEGIKIDAISAGANKLEGNWWEPMSDETRAHLQGQVDAIYNDFVRAVASGRGVSAAAVKDNYGQGRVFNAKEALSRGMVDAVETLDETIARMMKKAPKGSRSRAAAIAIVDDIQAAQDRELPDQLQLSTDGDDSEKCTTCNGSGSKPERFLSDPRGHEACESRNGTGKKAEEASAQATSDADYSALGVRIAELQ